MMEESATSRQEEVLLSEDEGTVEFEIEVVTSSVGSELSRNPSPDRDLDDCEQQQQDEEFHQEEPQVEHVQEMPVEVSLAEQETKKQVQEANIDLNTSTADGANKPDNNKNNNNAHHPPPRQSSPEAAVERELTSIQHHQGPDSSRGIPVEVPPDQRLQQAAVSSERSTRGTFEMVDGDGSGSFSDEQIGTCLEVIDKDDLRGGAAGEDSGQLEAGAEGARAIELGDSCAKLDDSDQRREPSASPSHQPSAAEEATSGFGEVCEQQQFDADEQRASDWTMIESGAADKSSNGQQPATAPDQEEAETAVQRSEAQPMGQRKRRRQQSNESNSQESFQSVNDTDNAAAEPPPPAFDSMSPVADDENQTSNTLPVSDDAKQEAESCEQADTQLETVAPDCDQPADSDISVQFEELPALIEVKAGALERRSSSMLVEASLEHEDHEVGETLQQVDDEFQMAPSVGAACEQSAILPETAAVATAAAASDQLSSSSSLHNLLNSLNSDATCGYDEEDLEREFDEEPEFKRRQVEVKRNRNPRDDYELGDELGRGKFGTVFRCTERASGLKLAAKFMHIRRREDRDDVEREVAIMSELQHKRLLQLYDAYDDGLHEMCLITELVEGGELFERIVDDDFDLTEKKAAIFMRQICEGADYMHEKQIVHLDMKPENILCLSRTGNRIKLIDFGLARRLDPNKPLRVLFGTPDFAAPEVLAYETVQLATDMWSVGVICYVLLSGLSPFMGDSDMETMANVMRATFDFNDRAFEAISELAKDFISKLLVREPDKRLKPSECMKHAWLQRGGAPLEAHIRERRESSLSVLLEGHHRLALEQAAMLTAAAAVAAPTATTTPPTPPSSQQLGSLVFGATFRPRASFGAESCASDRTGHQSLDKRRLKKYVVRRKWHKTVHAIMALGRMGANLKLA